MNTRLRELAIYAGYAPHWNTEADRNANFDKEKFADLIVNDCTVVLENEDSYYGVWAANVIKKHFGVDDGEI